MKIVMTERDSVGTDIDVGVYEQFGELITYPNTSVDNVTERVADADIIISNKVPLNETTLQSATHLKLICETATGYDNVDIEYCKKRGIHVTNVKAYSTATVVQHTFALLFYIMEKLRYYDDYVKSGAYSSQDMFSHFAEPIVELDQKTWGIIGMGSIGRGVAKVAEAFGAKVIYYSASGNSYDVPYERVDFDTILAQSDILSIHAPLNQFTKNLMTYEAFHKMKKSAYFINVGRGPIVNDADLTRALKEDLIAGAALDVLTREPMTKDNPLQEIKDSKRLFITPHIAWASIEARTRCVNEVAANIKAFIAGEERNVIC